MLVKLFQVFDFLRLINVELPINFVKFLSFFESNIFDILPNFLDIDETGICNLHPKLQENEMECFIVNSGGGILSQLIGWGLFKVGIMLLCLHVIGKKYKKLAQAEKLPEDKKKVKETSSTKVYKQMWRTNLSLNLSFFTNLALAV